MSKKRGCAMRGDIVVVRSFTGEQLERRVWGETDKTIYVVNDESFGLLMSGKEAPMPIGFRREDIIQN